MFSDPSTATGITWADHKGRLLLIEPLEQVHGIKTQYEKPGSEGASAVRANVYILDGDAEEKTYVDTLIFPKVLQSNVKPFIGGKVLGRLGQGQQKPGQSPPWTLAAASEDDKKVGRDFVAAQSVSAPPF